MNTILTLLRFCRGIQGRPENRFSFPYSLRILSELSLLIMIALFSGTQYVSAVPSYARQTGMSCSACHNAFPELNAFGRQFKLNGYNLTTVNTIDETYANKNKLKLLTISPLSAMAQISFTNLNKSIPGTQNNNAEFPQQLSLFYAGSITPRIGTFIQITYDPQSGTFGMDNADIRYSKQTNLASKDFIYGFTLNNNPTVQDIWNSTPAWGFPYAASAVAPSPSAATMLEGGLAQQVVGLGTYGFFDNLIYAEFSVYRSAQQGAPDPPGADAQMVINGVTPYWRLALQHQFSDNYIELGTYGLAAKIYPTGISGQTDNYTDIGLDLQFEHSLSNATFILHSSWIHEGQKLNASFPAGNVQNSKYILQSFKVDGSIYFKKGYGLTLGYYLVAGDMDMVVYTPGEVNGSRAGKPNSDGLIVKASWMPWYNTQFSLQYTLNNKFNGSGSNYDGFNRNASDNNSLYLLVWLNF